MSNTAHDAGNVSVRALDSRRAFAVAGRLLSLGFPCIWLRNPTQSERWTPEGPRPVPPERRGKAPVAEGWASTDALAYDELTSMWGDGEPGYNVGIRTGRVAGARTCVVVIDLDSPAAIEWARENLPETQIKVTSRADPEERQHWYYRAPPLRVGNRVKVRALSGEKMDLDVKGDGGLVVAPASVHGTGVVYRGILPWTPERVDSMPLFDPAWFGEDAEWEGAEDPKLRDGGERRPPCYVDLSLRRKRARAYLDGCPGTVSGQGTASAQCLYFARALVFGLCLPPEEAAVLMLQHDWNSRCVDSRGDAYPWDLEELTHKCRDAYRLAFGKPYGWMLMGDEAPGNVSPSPPPPADPEEEAARALDAMVRTEAEREEQSAAWDFDVPETDVPDAGKRNWPLTDTGNAERLAARFGEHVRYAEDRGKWYVWDGARWTERPVALERCAKTTARKIVEELPEAEARAAAATARAISAPDSDPKKEEAKEAADKARKAVDALRGWQKASESARSRRAMVELAGSEPSLAVTSELFDRHKMLLGARNGVIDLRAGARKILRPHDRDLYLTKVAPIDFDPDARAATWERCVLAWCGGDAEIASFLQRVAGYCLTGSVEEECLFVMCGGGQNGKSTFTNALASVLGPYAATAPAGLLMETRVDKATPAQQAGLATLVGARLVVASETDDSASFSEAQVKAITCRDRIPAKRMYESPFSFVPSHKVVLTTNHKPMISGTDDGIWRRVHLVEWKHKIPDNLRDNRLADKLIAERAGILAWAVRGCLSWQERGLDPPDAVRNSLRKYREEQDTMGNFLEELFVRDSSATLPKTQVRAAYEAWCAENGHRSFGAKRFHQEMTARGAEDARSPGARLWRGLRFRTAQDNRPLRSADDPEQGSFLRKGK